VNCEQERKWIDTAMASLKAVLRQQLPGGSEGKHKKLRAAQCPIVDLNEAPSRYNSDVLDEILL